MAIQSMTRFDASVGMLLVIAVAMHLPIVGLPQWPAPILALCLVIALAFRLHEAIHMALLAALAAAITTIPVLRQTIGQLPILPLLIPLLVSTLLMGTSAATRATLVEFRRGDVSKSMWLLVGVTGVGSAVALVAWAFWTDNLGIGEQMMASVSHLPTAVLAFIVIPGFALFNAVTEEAVFRGVLYAAIARSSGSIWLTVIVQAFAFAALHFEMGFPNGWLGYVMVLVWGLILGYVRAQTRGLMAPIVAHVLADLVIGYIVLLAVAIL